LSAAEGLDTTVGIYESPWFKFPRFRIKRFLKKHPPSEFKNIFIGGKSFGAFLLCALIEEGLFTQYENIACVFVDPHAPNGAAGDEAPINLLTHGPVVHAVNILQQDSWPQGAVVSGATNLRVDGANHWTIIDHTIVREQAIAAFNRFR
jgi:hypothetical protein